MRPIEFRRSPRAGERTGRRISDGRAWIEGGLKTAIDNGWIATPDERHICPACQIKNKAG